MSNVIRIRWDPLKTRSVIDGHIHGGRAAENSINEAMQRFTTEAELMMVWFAGLLLNLPMLRRSMDSIAGPPFEVAIADPYDDLRAMHLDVPEERVLDAYSATGDLEQVYGKAFVVFIYHAWEESARPAIASALGVEKDSVTTDLMNDWRYLRHWLLHPHQGTEDDYFNKAAILTGRLNIMRGYPLVNAKVVFELLGQLKVMQIEVSVSEPGY